MVSSGVQLLAGFDFDDPQSERRPYEPLTAYAQSKAADALFAVAISRRWAEDGICANACSPGSIHTNLTRHMEAATLQALGAMDVEGRLLTPDYYKTPGQGEASNVMLAAAPLLEGVTGRYFEHNQEAEVVEGGPHTLANGAGAMAGVASWSVDPAAADHPLGVHTHGHWRHGVRHAREPPSPGVEPRTRRTRPARRRGRWRSASCCDRFSRGRPRCG